MTLPLLLLCLIEIYKILIDSELNLTFIPLPDKIFMVVMIVLLICFLFGYRYEGKLFSNTLPVICVKPLAVVLILNLIFFAIMMNTKDRTEEFEPLKPAIDFLIEQDDPKNIILFTCSNEGSYVEFRGIKYYVDTRPEIFSKRLNHKEDIIKEYFDLCSGKLDYREFFSRYNFNYILVTEREKIPYLLLSNDDNYKMIFEDDMIQFGSKIHCKIFKPIDK